MAIRHKGAVVTAAKMKYEHSSGELSKAVQDLANMLDQFVACLCKDIDGQQACVYLYGPDQC